MKYIKIILSIDSSFSTIKIINVYLEYTLNSLDQNKSINKIIHNCIYNIEKYMHHEQNLPYYFVNKIGPKNILDVDLDDVVKIYTEKNNNYFELNEFRKKRSNIFEIYYSYMINKFGETSKTKEILQEYKKNIKYHQNINNLIFKLIQKIEDI